MTAVRLSSAVYLAAVARIAEEWSPSPSAVFGELLTSQPRTERPARFIHATVVPWAGERPTYRTGTAR